MKIEVYDENIINIFINSSYLRQLDFNSKDSIILEVKKFISKYKNILNLRGFYKIKVFSNKKVGMFLDIIKLDDNDYSNVVDLKVIVNMNDKIYFRTSNYYILPSNIDVYYLNNYFYCDIDNINNFTDVIEFGDYIYGTIIDEILAKAISI